MSSDTRARGGSPNRADHSMRLRGSLENYRSLLSLLSAPTIVANSNSANHAFLLVDVLRATEANPAGIVPIGMQDCSEQIRLLKYKRRCLVGVTLSTLLVLMRAPMSYSVSTSSSGAALRPIWAPGNRCHPSWFGRTDTRWSNTMRNQKVAAALASGPGMPRMWRFCSSA